ncbi:MAG: hypothetical protein ACOH2A_01400 [Sphingobacteriaceae bacterium]
MKIFAALFLILCYFSASAQWWKKKIVRSSPITQIKKNDLNMQPKDLVYQDNQLFIKSVNRSQYGFDLAEIRVMKSLKNSMRYRKVDDMRSDFNRLVALYLKQNRYSEAKWYLLQSNDLSRKLNDPSGMVASLIKLAMLKAEIGDFAMARQDLLNAREISLSSSHLFDFIEIEKKLQVLQLKKLAGLKADIRYAKI